MKPAQSTKSENSGSESKSAPIDVEPLTALASSRPTPPVDPVDEVEKDIQKASEELTKNAVAEIQLLMQDLLKGVEVPPVTPKLEHAMKIQAANLAPFKNAETVSLATNKSALDQAVSAAKAALETATSTWQLAEATYKANRELAVVTLDNAVSTAITSYKSAIEGTDSPSRKIYLYNQLEVQVAAAVTTFEGSIAGAQAAATSAMGALLSACATFRAAATAAGAAKASADATAKSTYWLAVENTLDNPS